MKRIIFLILLMSGFACHPPISTAKVKRHHKKHHAARVVYRSVAPRDHGVNANGNVGVGVGPIHIGVGAGAGVGVHEFAPPKSDPPADPMGASSMLLCPSLDTAMCNVPAHMSMSTVTPGDCDI